MNDRLDTLLTGWAKRSEAGPERMSVLRSRILEKVHVGGESKATIVPAVAALIPFRAKLRYAAIGAAVTAAVAIILSVREDRFQHPARGDEEGPRLALSESRAATGRRLFQELERLFPDRLRWVAESDGKVGLGVDGIPPGGARESPPVILRLVLTSREPGRAGWRAEWMTDVLVRGEDRIEVPLTPAPGSTLALWVYPLPDGAIAADTALSLHSPVRISTDVSTVMVQGTPVELAFVRAGNREYRVLQMARAL